MAERDPEVLSEEEAARLWARAAALQAAAEGKAPGVPDHSLVPASGRELSHVRVAAVEAGIAAEFVATALADLRVEQLVEGPRPAGRLAQRFLDNPPPAVVARRTIQATPAEVRAAMEAVFPAAPYRLTLIDHRGDPLDGGAMLFEIEGTGNPFSRGFAFSTQDAGIRRLVVTLRPLQGTDPSTELTIHGPLTAKRAHFGVGTLLSSLTGVAGLGVGLAGGFAVMALGVTGGILPVAAAAGALAGGGLGMKGFRALYRASLARVHGALEGLCGAVAVRAEGGWQDR